MVYRSSFHLSYLHDYLEQSVAVIGKYSGFGVIESECLGSWFIFLNSPARGSHSTLMETLTQPWVNIEKKKKTKVNCKLKAVEVSAATSMHKKNQFLWWCILTYLHIQQTHPGFSEAWTPSLPMIQWAWPHGQWVELLAFPFLFPSPSPFLELRLHEQSAEGRWTSCSSSHMPPWSKICQKRPGTNHPSPPGRPLHTESGSCHRSCLHPLHTLLSSSRVGSGRLAWLPQPLGECPEACARK